MKKKLIALLLSVLLVFTFAACSDENDEPTTENGMTNEADGAEETPEVTIPDAGINTDEEAVDFGIEVKKSFKMSGTLKKISYKDISESGEKLESMLNATLKKAQLGNFVLAFNDYEDDDADGIDKIAYVAAIEDDDMDKATIEMGVYHSTENDKYYQYNGYTSETLTGASASVKTILSKIESAYGIKMSQKKVETVLKRAWEKSAKREDFYGTYQTAEYKGDGHTDKITVRVDVGYDEGDNMGAYIYAERERLYT